MRPARTSARGGFSLLELTVVIAIISLVLGFGLSFGDNVLTAAGRVSTQNRMKTVQEALERYAHDNGFLPCPMDRAVKQGASNFGLESRNSTTKCGTGVGLIALPNAGAPQGYIGGVPVRTLGLPDSFAADAWHNKFTYAVSQPQIAGPLSYATGDPTIIVNYGSPTGTNYPVTSKSDASFTAGAGATYVIISHGPDGRGAYPLNGSTVLTACGNGSQIDTKNCDDTDLIFYDSDYNDGAVTAQFFDDYILWGSNLLQRMPTNANPYTNANACVTGCEAWCAPCGGGFPNLPVAPANLNAPVLCSKIITSTSPCAATCVWSGTRKTDNSYVRCP